MGSYEPICYHEDQDRKFGGSELSKMKEKYSSQFGNGGVFLPAVIYLGSGQAKPSGPVAVPGSRNDAVT
jgi:hypothetical protein